MNHLNSIANAGCGPARPVPYEGFQVAPAPQSQVEAALSQIDAGMQDLQNTVKRITERLEPALQEACVNAEVGEQATPISSTPLVRRLNAMATQLRQDCANLQDLERRLAL